jgi:hypothetical protein
MKPANKIIVYALIFLFFTNLNCFAQIQSSPLTLFDTWNIAVIGVQTDDYENFSEKQKLVSVTLRPILSSIIQEVDAHFLSTECWKNANTRFVVYILWAIAL